MDPPLWSSERDKPELRRYMTTTTNLGKIMMVPKGTYSASAAYEFLDIVFYNGASYICKQTTTGNLPTNNTYWQILAEKGNPGALTAGDGSAVTVDFDEAASLVNVGTGESLSTLFGKVKKLFNTSSGHDHDGIDSKKISYANNKNLLHNWDFRKPVNQRAVSGTITTGGYFLDRWIFSGTSVTINTGSITLNTGSIRQRFENGTILNGNYTVSVEISGIIYSVNLTYTGSDVSASINSNMSATILSNYDGYVTLQIYSNSIITITSIKLEIGSVSTLANDPPANYGEQLALCQRYFFNTNVDSDVSQSPVCFMATYVNELIGSILFPITMRIKPTLTIVVFRSNKTGTLTYPTSFLWQGNSAGINAIYYISFSGNPLITGEYNTIHLKASADL